MKKKDYIERAKQSIINRIRFHAPVVFDDNIDRRILFENGVNLDFPIFKFDKVLNKRLAKAFELAGREEKFNLLLSTKSLGREKLSLPNMVVYSPQNSPSSFLEMINKLNINYPSSSNYELKFQEKFFKINGEILNPHYDEFVLKSSVMKEKIWVQYREFVLNGSNFFVKMKNMDEKEREVELELNIPLEKGYFYFKKQPKCVLVENLLTKQKFFFNYVCRNAKFCFSSVDGLENSVFCCINARVKMKISPKEEKFVFFNFSQAKISLSKQSEFEEFEKIAKNKSCEIFDVKVKTKNPKFDLFFNKTLPQKIWINWLSGKFDERLEEKYISLKRLFVRGTDTLSFVHFAEIGLKEIGVFNGKYYKKIFYIQNSHKFVKIGKTCFYNVDTLQKSSLQEKEPIVISFGN